MGKKRLDLIGDRYGRLTVIKEVEGKPNKRYFLCKCDCGNEVTVYMGNLRNGQTKSCGCLRDERATQTRTKDLTNKKFSRLTAVEVIGRNENRRVNIWKCRCDCGNEIDVRTDHLLSREVRSCGCLKLEQDQKNIRDALLDQYIDGIATPLLRSKLSTNNTSGIKGLSWAKREKKWRAYIIIGKKHIHLGYFKNKEDAIKARLEAEEKYHKPYLDQAIKHKEEELE